MCPAAGGLRQKSKIGKCWILTLTTFPDLYIGVRGLPERDISSLGAMGWGTGGVRKFFHRRRRRRRRRPPNAASGASSATYLRHSKLRLQ